MNAVDAVALPAAAEIMTDGMTGTMTAETATMTGMMTAETDGTVGNTIENI